MITESSYLLYKERGAVWFIMLGIYEMEYLDPQGFLCALQLLLKIKSKKQNVDSSSWAAFLSFGDSAEKSLRLKSFQLIYEWMSIFNHKT